MATFIDNADREWQVNIDAPTIMAIRADCDPQFLLNDGDDDNTYSRLQSDPVLLCRVIYLLCKKERTERGVTEEDFYLQVIGDAIDRATKAMLDAIIFFTPGRTREMLKAIAQKQETVERRAMELALAKINDPNLEDQILATLEKRLETDVESALTQLLNATGVPVLSASPPSA